MTPFESDLDEMIFEDALKVARALSEKPPKIKQETFLRSTIASCAVFGTFHNNFLNLLDDVEAAAEKKDALAARAALEDLMHFHRYVRNLCITGAGPRISERIAKKLKEKK